MNAARWLAVCALAGGLALAGVVAARHGHGPAPSFAVGEALYLRGTLGSGEPLEATRSEALPLTGAAAACVNCHRRSGLGSAEGRNVIPPITGQFLFHPRAGAGGVDLPYIPGARADHEPYTPATLARAIREGIDSDGKPLSYLMPRFAIGDEDMAELIGYLGSLDRRHVPGVTPTELHFATIIAPDADPVKKAAMLAVLSRYFDDRNAAQPGPVTQMTTSGHTLYSKTMFKVNRRWVLHVWELSGPETGWGEQLDRQLAAQPVFATISGLAGRSWVPMQAFCERHALPCLFPNVERPPVDADQNFHTLYLSRGVLLEADLIAASLWAPPGDGAVRHVLQVYRAGDVGEAAAAALAELLRARGVTVTDQVLPKGAPGHGVGAWHAPAAGALVLWLRKADLAALPPAPPAPVTVYASGLMGGLERAPLPTDWRERTHLAYPVDLPDRRRVRVDYALGWFRIRNIAVVDEPLQADTYLACGLLSETMKHLIDAFVPDYLVERVEESLEHRILTGYYPRLSLAPSQRFASKGGYVVHLDPLNPARVIAEGDWSTP